MKQTILLLLMFLIVGGISAFANDNGNDPKIELANSVKPEVSPSIDVDFNLNKEIISVKRVLPDCNSPWLSTYDQAVNAGATPTETVYNYDEMRIERTVKQDCYDYSCYYCPFPERKTKTKTYYEYF
jgi:hypothetical protein